MSEKAKAFNLGGGHIKIEGVFYNVSPVHAADIVLCVNAYDTLKKKADALDELVRAGESVTRYWKDGWLVSERENLGILEGARVNAAVRKLDKALSKAKLSVSGEVDGEGV